MAAAASLDDLSQLYTKLTEKKGKGLFSPVAIKEGELVL